MNEFPNPKQSLPISSPSFRNQLTLLSCIVIAAGTGLISAGILLLGHLPLKYTIAAFLTIPMGLMFLLSKDKKNFFLCSIVFFLPFASMDFFLGSQPKLFHAGGAQSVLQINIVDLLLVAAYVHLIIADRIKLSNKSRLPIKSTISIGLFLLWCGLSIILSEHKLLGITSLFDLTKVFLLWIYMVLSIRNDVDIDAVVKYLIIGLAIQGAIGIYQAYFGFSSWASSITHGDTTTMESLDKRMFLRIGGTIGWTTVFAQYLCLLIPLSLAILVTSTTWHTTLKMLVCLFFSITALIFTLSRAGWLSLFVGSIITGILLYRHNNKIIRKRLTLSFVGVTFLFLLFFPLMKERILSDDYGSAMARLPMMRVAWNIIEENPFFGTGLNTYSEIMHRYDPKHLIEGFEYPVHNMYLFIAAEIGIPGLLFFLIFVGSIAVGLLRMPWKSRGSLVCISIGLLGGILALLTHGFVEQGIKADIQLWYVFSAVCGLAAAMPGVLGNSIVDTPRQ